MLAAAKDKVYLATSADPDLRGLLVEVETGGKVENLGSVIAERGNVSMLGLAVNQNGVVRATSTVSLNGSIRLVAGQNPSGNVASRIASVLRVKDAFYTEEGGALTLGEGSVTEVIPAGESVATDAQTQPLSWMNLAGKTVTIEKSARVTVTGGEILALAKADLSVPYSGEQGIPEVDAGIRIESGAVIDVSGDTSTVVPVSRNVVAVEARGNELADSPLQREGALRNETLYVDLRDGTPFLDSSGAVGLIERGVGERFSAGGTITLKSPGEVVIEKGAILDIEGGYITYTGDNIFTSQLVTADGLVFDIADADPDRIYVGILGADLVIDHAKWGQQEIFTASRPEFESGYIEGKDAGDLILQTRRLSFNGSLMAGSVIGPWQRDATVAIEDALAWTRPWDQRPDNGSVLLTVRATDIAPVIRFAGDSARLADPERDEGVDGSLPVVLSVDMLEASGIGSIALETTGRIAVEEALNLPDGGVLDLLAGRIDIGADLHSAGGIITLETQKSTGTTGITGNGIMIDDGDVALTVAAGVSIDVAGRWTNDSVRFNPELPTASIVLDGGDITLKSGGDLLLASGSLLDVGGGAWLDVTGGFTTGSGGLIALTSTDNRPADQKQPTRFGVEAELRGYAFADGGTLALTANGFLIGDTSADTPLSGVLLEDGTQRVLVEPALFLGGGFARFDLTATRDGVVVAPETTIRLSQVNRTLDGGVLNDYRSSVPSSSVTADGGNRHLFEGVPGGTPLDAFTGLASLPEHLRAPVDLALTSGYRFGLAENLAGGEVPVLEVAAGARILADPDATIELASDTSLIIDGRIDAPAGTISLALGSAYDFYAPEQMIYLGSQAELSVSGAAILEPDEPGFARGQVLDAGRVELAADFGSIVTAPGSRIVADGVVHELHLASTGGALSLRPVAGQAGEILLTAAGSILLQGALSAQGALDGLPGGDLSIALDPTARPSEAEELVANGGLPVPLDLRHPSGPRILHLAAFTGELPEASGAVPVELDGHAYIDPEVVLEGGFGALDLRVLTPGSSTNPDRPESNALIDFPGDVTLTVGRRITLDAPVLATSGAQVNLAAAYIAIGSTDTRFRIDGATPSDGGGTLVVDPQSGEGHLRVVADLVNFVGDTVLAGFGGSSGGTGFALDVVSRGDVRFQGTRIDDTTDWTGSLRVAGDVRITAQQLYPVTLTDFTLAIEAPAGSEGTIGILGQGGTAGQPLSVGGKLTLDADHIALREEATLRAPLGEIVLTGPRLDDDGGDVVGAQSITLEADSVISTSAAGLSIPFGYTQFREDLILPLPGEGITLQFVAAPDTAIEKALPQQNIRLTAETVDVMPGALFDVSGGGDVRATEFIAGPGGSTDILLADLDIGEGVTANSSFAILPLLGGVFAPFDPLDTPAAEAIQGIGMGMTLTLGEGLDGLPAGSYAVLPARYALFGGYLVTPVAGTLDLRPGQGRTRLDGAPILTAALGFAGSPLSGTRSQGFAIEDGTRIRLRAEYAESPLDALFADQAVRLPRDAGHLTIDAGSDLRLAGSVASGTAGGRGSSVDLLADAITLVEQSTGVDGVELMVGDLEALGADSLLIGGTREVTEDGLVIDAGAARIDVAAGVDLELRELILVADEVHLAAQPDRPTALTASGTAGASGTVLHVDGSAAVVLVSANRGITLTRDVETGETGALSVAGNATLHATGSILLDAHGEVSLSGTVDAAGGTIALGGSGIALGETEGRDLTGLVLSNAALARLTGSELALRSSGVIDIYGTLADAAGQAHVFERLLIDAQGIAGQDTDGASASLFAGELVLRNGSGASVASLPGSGLLVLGADRIVLSEGDFALSGFGEVILRATELMQVEQVGTLRATETLTIDAPVLTAAGGSDWELRSEGVLTVTGGDTSAALPDAAGPGAKLLLDAGRLDYAGNTVLPSGRLTLIAEGDVVLGNGARLDVAGRDEIFAGVPVGAGGGVIDVQSGAGSITLAASVFADVSGAPAGGAAGRLEFHADAGVLTFSPDVTLRGSDSGAGLGEFVANAGSFVVSGAAPGDALSLLGGILDDGFSGRRALRVREGDLYLAAGQTFASGEVALIADTGSLIVDGMIDASGLDGGSITLAAGDVLVINGTLDAHATATDGAGGRIELAAVDADGDDLANGIRSDVIHVNSGTLLDVRGGAEGSGGSVRLRATAYDGNGDGKKESVTLGTLSGTLSGAAQADVEGVLFFSDTMVTTADLTVWRTAIDTFMTAETVDLPEGWRLVPGLQISSTGDLTLSTLWDLNAALDDASATNDWRFGADNDIPGVLTLRASGDIRVNQSLTDGFVTGQVTISGVVADYEKLADSDSWSYRIVAGADASSADVMSTVGGDNDLVVAADRTIRTGTGSIDVAAGDDIDLDDGAAIYTAGRNDGPGPVGDIDVRLISLSDIIFDFETFEIIFEPATGEEFLLTLLDRGQFPVGGGDLRITAGGDVIGEGETVNVTDWQTRIGGDNVDTDLSFTDLPTHWAIAYQAFGNGLGTLGGGDLSARIGGDLRNVAVALPTSGKPVEAVTLVNDEFSLVFAPGESGYVTNGGGDLALDVGGDLTGGAIQVDRGSARIRVGGSYGATGESSQPYLALADSVVDVEARGNLNLGGVFNSTALPQSGNLDFARTLNPSIDEVFDPLFFTWSDGASATLTSLSGDIAIADPAPVSGHGFDLYAPTLSVRSLEGGISIDGDLRTWPAAGATLELLAEGDIGHALPGGRNFVIQSDADPALLPSASEVVTLAGNDVDSDDAIGVIKAQYFSPPASGSTGATVFGQAFHAGEAVHSAGEASNLVVSRSGSIEGKSSPLDRWEFLLAKSSVFSAGQDVRDMSIVIQHVADTDLSLIAAYGDIIQTLSRNPGNGSFEASEKIFEIGGAGRIDFVAGGDIDLGSSRGIVSVGDTRNPALADSGASVLLSAGLAEGADHEDMIRAYLEESDGYASELGAFLASRGADPGVDPVGAFRALSPTEQRGFIATIFFNEIRESGRDAKGSGSEDYSRGFAAIATLFPEGERAGDIRTLVSVIRTDDGGDISLFAPYGDIIAGATFRAIEKEPADLGVITGRGGNISLFLDGDLQVNRERIFALQGDLLGWSSNGDMDAGKGAKTIASVPDPVVVFDANGNAIVIFPPAVGGSGLASGGDADLFTPHGTVNAGDAGIRVGGNLTIGAVEVIGADNIDVGGVAVGVPVSASVPVSVSDAGSALNSATSAAEQATRSATGDGGGPDNAPLGLVSVELLGFGEEGVTAGDNVGAQLDKDERKRL